ncbi:MAG: radical SAM family heme chaperone HemW [Taibaiella sp.]|nr:radical SAM family heme chaperone HemW [Taibaiella sp.]
MSGIYIHIPFCKQACSYCDFHFSTSLRYKDEMIGALIHEIELSKGFLPDRDIRTIYFGGGTPSLLLSSEILRIVDKINSVYDIGNVQEITLEANPDDLSSSYLYQLRSTPVNRLSIGVQSFQEEDLKLMNRAHNAGEAEAAIKRAQDMGLDRMSCDLIFGTPTLSHAQLKANIGKLASWNVPHISAYSLTIEDRTLLYRQMLKGQFQPASEVHYEAQMKIAMDYLEGLGYEQYEISNYARDEQYAVHNTNYWKGIPYLGIGPSAHSFDGKVRRWNVRNNARYMKSVLSEQEVPSESELLTIRDQINERILTSFRTKWGLDTNRYSLDFGVGALQELLQRASGHMAQGYIVEKESHLVLAPEGRLIADQICSDLFELNP